MHPRDSHIRYIVEGLAIQVLSRPEPEHPKVFAHLNELLDLHEALLDKKFEEPAHLQVCYDLILVTASKIEREFKRSDWIIERLLLLSDECIKDMSSLAKEVHPFRRGMVLYKYLSYSVLYDLGAAALARLREFFMTSPPVTLGRRLKMTLGNVFAGPKNISILAEIYPYLIQWGFPVGKFKEEVDQFLNALFTDLLTLPKMNEQISVLTRDPRFSRSSNTAFTFAELMNFFLNLSDKTLEISMGETPNCPWVKMVRSGVIMLREFRLILSVNQPNRLRETLADKRALRENVLSIFKPVRDLVPIYSFGSELDLALNELVVELRAFSEQVVNSVSAPESPVRAQPPVWDIMGPWTGFKDAFRFISGTCGRMFNSFVPKIYLIYIKLLSDNDAQNLAVRSKPHFDKMCAHATKLAIQFDQLGVYHPVTQVVIAPFKSELAQIKLECLQRMMAIYHHQMEGHFQTLSTQASVEQWWDLLQKEDREHIKINFVALIRQINELLMSLLPLFTLGKFTQMREALNPQKEMSDNFDKMIVSLMELQTCLKNPKDGIFKIKRTIDYVLLSSGGSLSAGSAAHAIPVMGRVIAGAVNITTANHMDLSFKPSSLVDKVPREWEDLALKQILKNELNICFKLIEDFVKAPLDQIYLKRIDFGQKFATLN